MKKSKEIEYEDFTNFLINEAGSCIATVCGEQGVGKTSFCTAWTVVDYNILGRARLARAEADIEQLNLQKEYDLHCPAHAYFSKDKIHLDLNGEIDTHYINVDTLGLPGAGRPVQYFPEGSFVYISEIDTELGCRDWTETPNDLIELFKLIRHNGMTLIFDLQSFDRLEIVLRSLTIYKIFITDKKDFYDNRGRIIKTRWRLILTANQMINTVREISKIVPDFGIEKKLYRYFEFEVYGDIYKLYNSFSGKKHFLNEVDKNDYIVQKHPTDRTDPKSVKEYCQRNKTFKPKETTKNESKNNKQTKNS